MLKADLSKASSLVRLDDFCAKYDLDYQEMLSEAKLPLDVLEHLEDLIPFSRVAQLLENCARRSGQPLFALQYGIFQGPAVLGRLLYLIKNAETVGESLKELGRYYRLHSSGGQISLEVDGSMAIMKYEPVMFDGARNRHGTERIVGIGRALLKMLLGARSQLRGAYFQSGPITSPNAYQRLLGITPQFDSTTNALVFDAKLLDLPVSESDPELRTLMREHLDRMDALSGTELPDYVQELIRRFLPEGLVTTEKIADYMMLSSRSLQRYLAAEGTSFQKLLDNTRQNMAEHYLLTSEISLTQLAGFLGYADLATFSRAFQRWYGVSPRQWRIDKGIASTTRRLNHRRKIPSWFK